MKLQELRKIIREEITSIQKENMYFDDEEADFILKHGYYDDDEDDEEVDLGEAEYESENYYIKNDPLRPNRFYVIDKKYKTSKWSGNYQQCMDFIKQKEQ
jgi:hypothetical protein